MFIVRFNTEGEEIGRITSCADIPDEFHPVDAVYEGIYVDERPNYFTDYVDGDVIEKRPVSTASLEGNILSGLVVGGKLTIRGQSNKIMSFPITEPTATMNFPLPGKYKIIVEAWPMLEKEFELTV